LREPIRTVRVGADTVVMLCAIACYRWFFVHSLAYRNGGRRLVFAEKLVTILNTYLLSAFIV
ncbi:MAG: hypothetical protein WBB43_19950, partial [Limnoraphis sp.]